MKTKSLLLTAVLLALAGCGEKPATPPPPPPKAQGCTSNCVIQVTVEEAAGPPVSCKITKPAATHEYTMGRGKNAIKWHLNGPSGKNYEFDDKKGIDFVTSPHPFTLKSAAKLDFEFDDDNKGGQQPKYKYKIYVRSEDGKTTCDLDPYVINDP